MDVYYDKDANQQLVQDKKIAVIGYGSQGHAHALNLRDSGAKNIVIALREGSSSIAKAQKDGFKVLGIDEAVQGAELVVVLVPDELQSALYTNHLEAQLQQGAMLMFAHGLAIHFKLIKPRPDLDVAMVAPKGPGHTVRAEYLKGAGVPCLLAVHQNPSNKAHELALSYASNIGGGRAGVIETDFRQECETDLFGEQAVLCGGLSELIKAGFETLVANGYDPHLAYFECLHEVKLIVDLMYEGGIANMNYSVSNTAEYGGYVSGPRIVDERTKAQMKKILGDIQSGAFTKRWMGEGQEEVKGLRVASNKHPIEEVGRQLRAMMPWIAKNRLVDKAKN